MIRALAALLLSVLAAGCTTMAPAPAAAPPYTDLSQAFVEFYDRTQRLDDAARVAAFKEQVAPLFPAFYSARGRTAEQHDRMILNAIRRFPEIRDKYVAAQRAFPGSYADAIAHFRTYFPDSTASLPTYLIHSLGEMDGGTRELEGRTLLIFGADGLAQYHTPETIGPFFDHQLFHVEHDAHFPECEPVWCALWTEGLATAAAAEMNPGIDYRGLMLTIPRPIAPEVDARWREALCYAGLRTDSESGEDYKAMFQGNGGTETLPPRWGYYLGFRLAKRLLNSHSLAELAHLSKDAAEPLVKGELETMIGEAGGCPARAETAAAAQ